MQTVYNTTITEYTALLHQWHKGNAGGLGLNIYFETWSDEKLNRYNIYLDDYDHTNVASRLALLIENYVQDGVKKHI